MTAPYRRRSRNNAGLESTSSASIPLPLSSLRRPGLNDGHTRPFGMIKDARGKWTFPAKPSFYDRLQDSLKKWLGQRQSNKRSSPNEFENLDFERVTAGARNSIGERRLAVVLVNFRDRTFGRTTREIEELYFSTSQSSVRSYFDEVSSGRVSITGKVFGPFDLIGDQTHYANNGAGMTVARPNSRSIAIEAVQALRASGANLQSLASSVELGLLDGFVLIHSGDAGELTGDIDKIHSHKDILAPALELDGLGVPAYAISSESSPLGVHVHELAHLLFGLDDLYGVRAVGPNSSETHGGGVSEWCLMSEGNWNDGGLTPAHLCAWNKANLGWIEVENVEINGQLTVNSIHDAMIGGKAFRLWRNGERGPEYFLIENRTMRGFDRSLQGSGLLVWHIDETRKSNDDPAHPRVGLEQADGFNTLQSGGLADSGDPFHAGQTVELFSGDEGVIPNSRAHNGDASGVRLSNFSAAGISMTVNVRVRDLNLV